MSTNASDPGTWSETVVDDSVPPVTPLDEKLMNILSEMVAEMVLEWSALDQPSKKWMHGSYLQVRCQ